MAGFGSQYILLDDNAVSTSVGSGGGSGAPVTPQFSAGSLADAQTVAAQIATVLNRTVRLAIIGGTPPWTSYAPSSCRVLPSAVPPSITF